MFLLADMFAKPAYVFAGERKREREGGREGGGETETETEREADREGREIERWRIGERENDLAG